MTFHRFGRSVKYAHFEITVIIEIPTYAKSSYPKPSELEENKPHLGSSLSLALNQVLAVSVELQLGDGELEYDNIARTLEQISSASMEDEDQ